MMNAWIGSAVDFLAGDTLLDGLMAAPTATVEFLAGDALLDAVMTPLSGTAEPVAEPTLTQPNERQPNPQIVQQKHEDFDEVE